VAANFDLFNSENKALHFVNSLVGGNLIRLVRDALFRQDQQILPLLEASPSGAPSEARSA
jgi:hypothetical protein